MVKTSLYDTTFCKTQQRLALRNCGVIDPESIDEYIAMTWSGVISVSTLPRAL